MCFDFYRDCIGEPQFSRQCTLGLLGFFNWERNDGNQSIPELSQRNTKWNIMMNTSKTKQKRKRKKRKKKRTPPPNFMHCSSWQNHMNHNFTLHALADLKGVWGAHMYIMTNVRISRLILKSQLLNCLSLAILLPSFRICSVALIFRSG